MLFNINNKLAQLLGLETQSSEEIKMEKELRQLSREDVIHSITFKEPKLEKKEDDVVEEQKIENEIVEEVTEVTDVVKTVETNETEQPVEVIVTSNEVVEKQEEVSEETQEQEENQVETTTDEVEQTGSEDVSEDTVVETQEVINEQVTESVEEPLNEVSDIEPSDLIHSAETEQLVHKAEVETTQEVTEETEMVKEDIEPSSEIVEVENVTDNVEVEITNEAIQAVEPEQVEIENVKIDIPTPSSEVNDELERVKQELAQMKAKEAEQALKLEKAEIEREVMQDYSGIPLSTNETVDFLYEIKNSTLQDSAKDFILNSLKQLSVSNLKDCQEVGHQLTVEDKSEKELLKEKVQQAQNEHDLTEGQALLFVTGARTLKQAKEVSNKTRRRNK